jgi:hypothetical protein
MQQKYNGILSVISKIVIKHMDQRAHYYNIKNLNIVFNDNLSFNKYNFESKMILLCQKKNIEYFS